MNIVYLHAHDAGRFVQPYGYPVETPHLMKFARQAVLFRKAFCVAPTCGPSRAALLSGQYPHQVGMYGLPGPQGWKFDDPRKHLVRQLGEWGYETVLAGCQHECDHADLSPLGYTRILGTEAPAQPKGGEFYQDTIDRVERFLRTRQKTQPFFLSVGIDEPHRDNIPRPDLGLMGGSRRFSKTRPYQPEHLDSRYTAPPPWLPDLPEIRADFESYREGVHIMDEYMGRVLGALKASGLEGNTLVIVTSDHGIEFPGGKMTLSDQGLQVMLMMRGPDSGILDDGKGTTFKRRPGSTLRGGRVLEPMVSQLDIFPTICDLLGKEPPPHLEGKSLMPLVHEEELDVHDTLFFEQTYHGGVEALRGARTERYKYVRRLDATGFKMTQDGPSTAVLKEHGWFHRPLGHEELFDLYLDPMEAANRIADPALAGVKADLAARLDAWMARTNDPFRHGEVPPVPNG